MARKPGRSFCGLRRTASARHSVTGWPLVESRSASFHKPAFAFRYDNSPDGERSYAQSGRCEFRGFHAVLRFELVTDATCQHQGGMILKIDKERRTKPSVSRQSSRWRRLRSEKQAIAERLFIRYRSWPVSALVVRCCDTRRSPKLRPSSCFLIEMDSPIRLAPATLPARFS
jgi:hypothetical protein